MYVVQINRAFLDDLARSRKTTISFVMSVCLSTWKQLGSHWMDFCDIWYLNIFLKSVEKIQFSLKSDKNNGYFAWIPEYIYDISLNSSYNEKIWDKSCRENKSTHFCSITFFFRTSCCLWDNVEKYGTDGQATNGNTIRRMLFACSIAEAINTDSNYVILITFPLHH